MNTVSIIYQQIETLKKNRLIQSSEILVLKHNIIKARLLISENLFVQIYRNDRFNTTSFSLILNRKRFYGRDEIQGKWHRHPVDFLQKHNFSKDGSIKVDLLYFWQEVENIVKDMKFI